MPETWTCHERPDGHRSLWFKAVWWIVIDLGKLDNVVLWVGPLDGHRVACGDKGMRHEVQRHGCPVPTAADLAWLRGE